MGIPRLIDAKQIPDDVLSVCRRLREAGLEDLAFEQIIELNQREIDPDLVRALRQSAAG